MKKVILYTSVCVISFIFGVSLGTLTADKAEYNGVIAKENETSVSSADAQGILKPQTNAVSPGSVETKKIESNRFLLSLSDNGISVYKVLGGGQTEFLYKKEMNTAMLRNEDYTRLCAGIMVHSEQEAKEIIEDFIS